jgi:putative membrane-bound dehydrogenase-like protein
MFCSLMLLASIASDRGAATLPVGVAEVDITPDYPIRLSGFGFRRAESEGVNCKIFAKALAIADEKNGPAILVTVDNVGIPDEITTEVAQRLAAKIGLKRERFTVTATHTHTAPMLRNLCATLFGVAIPADHQAHIDRYTREFTDHVEEVALAAFKDIRPAEISWGTGTAGFAVNRRTKDGPVDHDLPVLVVREPGGKVRAVYFSYACHCVTLSDNKISGDWSGYAQKRIEEMYPGAVALASVGCGADSNPSSGVTAGNTAVCDDQGKQIADEVKRLVSSALAPITARPEIHYTRVDLPLAKARTRAEWEQRAKRNDAVGYHARLNLERLDRGEKIPAKLNYAVQSWVFGNELAIIFMPGETVVDYSLRLKREFDRSRLWINGYSNDSRCYIPSERILKEGGYEGGEAMIYYDAPQFFAPGLEQKLISAVHAQLPTSYKAPPGTEGIPALSPQAALRTFQTKPGLKVELVASEPLIESPVAIDWAADGKLWVCEMNDYPSGVDQNWKPGGRVKFLEDLNGDGIYEKATLFADNLPFPTGITAWGHGVLICAAPDILYAEDTNGDGKADKIEKLFTGFVTDNYQARVNSLTLGLDNWIYGANGLLGGTVEPVRNSLFHSPKFSINARNHDFRFHPFTGAFELVSGLTQQGRVRDDWDNWFGCNNSELLIHFAPPERYIRRNPSAPAPNPSRLLANGPDANRLYPTSRLLERFNDPGSANRVTSGCGLGVYRDRWLGEEFYGNAFTCEPVHNLVHREVMDATHALSSHRPADEQNSEFLSSSDNWFRPVQARPGPDGALYIVDMYRFLIEHPRWIPAARLAQLDVRAGADKGRIYRVVKEGATPRPVRDLAKLNGEQLAAALDTPNGIERDRVHLEILLRRDKSASAPLRKLASAAALPQIRIQALSALDGISSLDNDSIKLALKDSDEHVRQQAIRLAEPNLNQLLDSVVALTNATSMTVLRQLAYSLGESSDERAGKALASLAQQWIANVEMRTAVLSSAKPHAEIILNAIVALDPSAPGRSEWISPLIATIVNSSDRQAIARAVKSAVPSGDAAINPGNLSILAKLLDSLDQKKIALDDVVRSGTPERARLDSTIAAISKLAADANAPDETRQIAVALLGRGKSQDELDLLSSLAHGPAENLRTAALSSLKRKRGASVAESLLQDWPKTSPAARAQIVAFLLDREEWTIALLNAVERGAIGPQEVSISDRQRLAASEKSEIRKLAAEVLPAQTASARDEVINNYKRALTIAGKTERGADVFARNCSVCHQLNGVGSSVGPDLVALRSKDPEYWLKNILDPNAVIEPRFINYSVELKDDRTLSGVIRGETANSLTLVAGGGKAETIARSEIADIRASTLSLMPEGLEQGISLEEMADLIAYLRSGAARKVVDGNDPKPVAPNKDGSIMLSAANAEIYGNEITFEEDFKNIGMWHGDDDHVAWTIELPEAATYDVYVDYASSSGASGNKFALIVADQSLKAPIAVTGPNWDQYKQIRAGQIKLPSGAQRVIFSPEGQIHSALLDLRTVALVPVGKKPRWPTAEPTEQDVLRDAPSVARFILDSRHPQSARESAIQANPQFAATLITEMTRDLPAGSKEEYTRIPWIWRVAIACGKRNDSAQIAAVLDAALPQASESLRDWQAVVIGGGIINGLSQHAIRPADRIEEILKENSSLKKRWSRAVELASAMAEDARVPNGTRYDALRIVAMEPWEKRGHQLSAYLKKGTDVELQMGAVSGLVDMKTPQATAALLAAMKDLEPSNRELAQSGLAQK